MFFFSWFFNIFKTKKQTITEEVPMKTSTKRALLVGINKYAAPGCNLSGCVNDIWDMYELLTKDYGFEPDNVRVIIDERATFDNILERLKWLIKSSEAGDESVYYHSGHGSQCRDRNGDELSDQLDECLVTHDHDWDDPFIDDILHDTFKELDKKAFLSVIVDTCHSGTISRGLVPGNHGVPADESYCKEKFIVPPLDILTRSLDRDLDRKTFGSKAGNQEEQRHVLLSGCKESETSKELRLGNSIRGALTFNLTKFLRANPNASWTEAHEYVLESVKKMQHPQLRGTNDLKDRKVFGGRPSK